ncbi:MAG TPA: hypothetical protein V6C86_12070 [Oculatellaceae cyanobacterium]
MEQQLETIRNYTALFGLAYFIFALPFDVYFVRKISQLNWSKASLFSLAGHGLSTLSAFYALPVVAYALTRSDQTCYYTALLAGGTGAGTSLCEYVCLRLLLKKQISGRHLSFLYWNKFAIFWLSTALVLAIVYARHQ